MRSTTLLITAAILAVTACGADDADEPQGPPPEEPAGDPADGPADSLSGEPIDAELVLLADSVSATVAPPTVLDGPTSIQAYPGWYSAEPDLYDQVHDALTGQPDYPNSSRPLVAFTNGPSCASIDEAELMVDGTQVYAEFHGQEHEECYAPLTQVAIFEVDRADLPKRFTLVGTDSSGADEAAGPGALLAFEKLDTTPGFAAPPAQEVTDESALDDFVSKLPSHQDEVVGATDGIASEQRVFGFVLTGCAATTAELIVTPSRVTAGTVGGEAVRCLRPFHYVAVFAMDDDRLPDRYAIR